MVMMSDVSALVRCAITRTTAWMEAMKVDVNQVLNLVYRIPKSSILVVDKI